jgi:O-antigen/teichoic acid export membrane protein
MSDTERPSRRPTRFSWGIALSSGAVAVGVSAFLETLVRNFAGPDAVTGTASLGSLALSGAAVAVANMLGGYLAARRSRNRPLMHALVAGAICNLFFVLMMIAPANEPGPVWFLGVMLVVPMVAAVCGARLARRSVAKPH